MHRAGPARHPQRHKLVELRRILEPLVRRGRCSASTTCPPYDEMPETGATFADNALVKAREAARHTGLVTVADDSGLAVDALNGMPGVLSARWAGRTPRTTPPTCAGARASWLTSRTSGCGAAFVCAAALAAPDGADQVVEGRMPGRLIRAPRGSNGFGYDPMFVPDGHDVTSAELDRAAKDAISHRGRALRALLPELIDVLTDSPS